MGEVILVASGKGGSGKTTFAVNIASVLAASGRSCIVLDLNVGLRNADIYMGLENSVVYDLGDVVSGVCGIEKAIVSDYRYPNLSLLCGPQYKGIDGFGEGHVKALYNLLRQKYDYVIVDSPAGLGQSFCAAASGVDASVIILTPDYQALRNADTVDKRLEAFGIAKRFCILNMVNQDSWGNENIPGLDDITKTLYCPLIGVVQTDPAIHIANNCGEPIALEGDDFTREMFASIVLGIVQN